MKIDEINTLHDEIINEIISLAIKKKSSYIIKELLENSCDANSKNISVYVENNGLNLIKVIDDGIGINKDDLHKCGLRYTTSKIKKTADLKNIYTLGFKGESLNLIKSLAKLIIISKTPKQKYAYKINHFDNNTYTIEECAGNNGTEVLITNLKTGHYKLNENVLIPQKIIALANFDIHFKFYKDLKEIYNLPPCHDMYSISKRIEKLLDEKYLENSINIEYENYGINIQGFITENKNKYKDNNNYLFLNKRYIDDNYINNYIKYAIKEKTYKNSNYIIYLTIHPERFNIYKAYEKTHIHFNNITDILCTIKESIKKYLKTKTIYKDVKKKEIILKKNDNAFQIINKNILPDDIYKSTNKILTVLENTSVFFELNKKVYLTNLVNLRSKIIIEDAIKQMTKNNKLTSRDLQETIFINIEQKEKIKTYKNILIKYGFNIEIFFDEKIIIQAIPEIIFNFPINMENLIKDIIKFLDKNITIHFSINRFDITLIELFTKHIDMKYNCFNFELKKFYEEIKNCYNDNDSWFKKYCFEVSCKKALNSFKN